MPSPALACTLRRRLAHAASLAVLVGCGAAVAGCTGAVETVRAVRGVNKNDPDPVAAPFTGNMAAAEAAPYPNLASVPLPPVHATTAAERSKLSERLVAERTAAQAAGGTPGTAPPIAATPSATATTADPATGTERFTVPASTAAASPPTRIAAAAESPRPRSAAGNEAEEPLPRDSELRMPQVRSLPEPDGPRPAPPPPRLRPVPPPEQLPPAAIASAVPQPAPSVPELAPVVPPPAAFTTGIEPSSAPTATTVAMLDAPDASQIAQVASRYRESGADRPPRAVRVVAYTVPPAPGADPLGLYHEALQRAQGVAKALAEAGIPEKMIQTEAKPAPGPIAASRIEIQFLP
jgi:hypothetical protein